MKSLRWFGLLLILGISAVATKAQTAAPDPGIFLDDPSCPSGVYCVDLTYDGTSPLTIAPFLSSFPPPTPFNVSVPDPPGSYSALPPLYTCNSNIFSTSLPTGTLSLTPGDSAFTGCDFWGGTINPGTPGMPTVLTLYAVGGPVELAVPEDFSCSGSCSDGIAYLGPTPEPSTALLYLTGILCLVVFGRRRLKAHVRT